MYLPTLTDDELLRYAGTLPHLTALEAELVERLTHMEGESFENKAYAETQEEKNEELEGKVGKLEEVVGDLEEKVGELETELIESLA